MASWHLRGTVLPEDVDRDVYVVGGRISFAPVPDATTLATDVVIVPGLVDVHAHLSLSSPAGAAASPEERVRASAKAHLDAGVLAIREPGSPDRASFQLGPAEGLPRVVTAGRFLAPPGRYFPGLAREVTNEELPDAAVEELAATGDWVKLIADSPVPGPGPTATFASEAITETVRRVHEGGGRVAVHCMLTDVIQVALEAGVDSIEHGTYLQTDQVPLLVSSGATWVPTQSIHAQIRPLLPPEQAARLDHQAEVLLAAVDAGVTVLAGTDAGMCPHGLVRYEVTLLHESGLSPHQALAAASWSARDFLRLPRIAHGAFADLVAFRADPRDDLGLLAEPTVVVLDGKVVRRPG